MMNDKLVLKNRLKVARAEKDISQGDLAEMVGVSRQTISSIETGQFNPNSKACINSLHSLWKKSLKNCFISTKALTLCRGRLNFCPVFL